MYRNSSFSAYGVLIGDYCHRPSFFRGSPRQVTILFAIFIRCMVILATSSQVAHTSGRYSMASSWPSHMEGDLFKASKANSRKHFLALFNYLLFFIAIVGDNVFRNTAHYFIASYEGHLQQTSERILFLHAG